MNEIGLFYAFNNDDDGDDNDVLTGVSRSKIEVVDSPAGSCNS